MVARVSFSDEVDAALQGMRVVLGTGDPPAPRTPTPLSAAPTWPNWTGVLSDAAQHASDNLDRTRTQIYFDQVAAVPIIKHAGDITTGARQKLDSVVAGWQQDKARFDAIKETPLGQLSLLHAGQQRLTDARDVVRDAMTQLSTAAQNLQTVAGDLPTSQGTPDGPRPLTQMLLPVDSSAAAPAPDEQAGEHKPEQEGIDLHPTGADIANAAEGAIAGTTADGVRQTTLDLLKAGPSTGPGAADPWLLKWFEDPTAFGRTVPGFSRLGGVVAVASAVPAVMADIGEGNSVPEAVTRETAAGGVALFSGSVLGGIAADSALGAAMGSVVPGAGTALGLVVGAGVGAVSGFLVSKGVEAAWQPVSNAVSSVAHSVESVFGFG
jgi:hypothetical protein